MTEPIVDRYQVETFCRFEGRHICDNLMADFHLFSRVWKIVSSVSVYSCSLYRMQGRFYYAGTAEKYHTNGP